MKSFTASIEIFRPPEVIWSVLMDTASYADWAVGTHRLEGEMVEGGVLTLSTVSKPDHPMQLKVSHLDPPQSFVLSGGLPLGLFRGDRTVALAANSDGSTQVTMTEVFSGLLAPILSRQIPDLTPSFEGSLRGLKARCEEASHR